MSWFITPLLVPHPPTGDYETAAQGPQRSERNSSWR